MGGSSLGPLSANQLIREDNQTGGYSKTWTYDQGGNILERKEYAYTTGSLTGITPTNTAFPNILQLAH